VVAGSFRAFEPSSFDLPAHLGNSYLSRLCSKNPLKADRFPNALHPFVRDLPLTAVIDALRAQILQGAPLSQLTAQLAVITGWLVLCFFTALKLSRWR
jgi:hypothetical protein